MPDRVSRYRSVRLNLHPPAEDGGNCRWSVLALTIRNGIPSGSIVADGVIASAPSHPSEHQMVELFDAALSQMGLFSR
jgi:hypothetical protein